MMVTWTQALQLLRGKAVLNWAFKIWDIVAAPPLTDQLAHYSKVHETRTQKLDTIVSILTRVEVQIREQTQRIEALEERLKETGER